MLRMVALGGLGRVGGNLTVYETDDDLVVVDCGLCFPDDTEPGVDYLIPEMTYLFENADKVRGVILTHGHEDHLGALPFLLEELDVPVYGTDFTLALLAHKLGEYSSLPVDELSLRPVRDNEIFFVGRMAFTPIPVTHSIPGAIALALDTPVGTVVHTGDLKLDDAPIDGRLTDLGGLRALGDRGVVALFSDSTNATRPGRTATETRAGEALDRVIRDAPRAVIVTAFSSNVHRIQSVITAAHAAGRKVAPVGRSISAVIELAIERGFLHAPGGVLVPSKVARHLPRRELLVIASGCQGEARSALRRIAAGEHREVSVEPGDRVIFSSRRIPGNGRAIDRMTADFLRLGAAVIDANAAPVHASGHACQDELTEVLRACRPQFFVPIHGEVQHLSRHAELGREAGIPDEQIWLLRNGQPVDFVETDRGVEARLGEPVPATWEYIDAGENPIDDIVVRDRRVLSFAGFISATVVTRPDGALLAPPTILTRGVLHVDESAALIDEAAASVAAAWRKLRPHASEDDRYEAVRLALRRFFKSRLGCRPIVLPVIVEVSS